MGWKWKQAPRFTHHFEQWVATLVTSLSLRCSMGFDLSRLSIQKELGKPRNPLGIECKIYGHKFQISLLGIWFRCMVKQTLYIPLLSNRKDATYDRTLELTKTWINTVPAASTQLSHLRLRWSILYATLISNLWIIRRLEQFPGAHRSYHRPPLDCCLNDDRWMGNKQREPPVL